MTSELIIVANFIISTSKSSNGQTAVTAWDLHNPGSYEKQELQDPNRCPNMQFFPLLFHQTGNRANPWKEETIYRRGSWWRLWNETGIDEATGAVTSHRNFREDERGNAGMTWLPVSFDSLTGFECTDGTGCEKASETLYGTDCGDVPRETIDGESPEIRIRYVGTLPRWMQDHRTGSTDTRKWYPVQAIAKEDTYSNGENIEIYTYGRWIDPRTGRYEGLGLIGFSVRGPGTNYVVRENHYLTDGNPSFFCPGICPVFNDTGFRKKPLDRFTDRD